MNLFFDLDGPILDVKFRHHRVYAEGIRAARGIPLAVDDFWELKRARASDAELLHRSGLGPETLDQFRAHRLRRIEEDDVLCDDLMQPGMTELLPDLAARHPLYLVTVRRCRDALERQLARLNLARHFVAVLSGQETAAPAWQLKRDLIVSRLRPAAGIDWIVGDTETEILAGRALGLRTVAVSNGIRTESFLATHKPDYLLPSADQFRAVILPP